MFLEKILIGVAAQMTQSRVGRVIIWNTGLDVKILEDSIDILMQEYIKSLEGVDDIRKTETRFDSLADIELKLYWKIQNPP